MRYRLFVVVTTKARQHDYVHVQLTEDKAIDLIRTYMKWSDLVSCKLTLSHGLGTSDVPSSSRLP